MKQLQTSLRAYELKNHPTLQKTCCSKCGTIKLPGINHKVEIRKRVANTVNNKKNDKKVNKQRKNQLVENCLACGHVKMYYGSQKKKLPKDTETKQVKLSKEQLEKQQPQKNIQPNKQQNQLIPEKKKKNKSKKNNLQALLSKQKEQKQSASSPAGGNLNDFLSSL
jgi:RNase P subunit RPR2